MGYLNWTLDTEDGIDAYDPLGHITIMGEQGKLEDKCTFLDAFFEALIEGVQRIEQGKIIEIDTIVEPDDIIFDYTNKHLALTYGNQKTIILNTNKFIQDIYNSVKTLIETLDNAAIKAKQEIPKLIILRNFVQKHQDS